MKRLLWRFILINLLTSQVLAVEGSVVEIHLTGIAEPGGQILISFENNRAQYEASGGKIEPFRAAIIEATETRDVFIARFEGVPFGAYTVRAFYDKNRDRELDTNLVGYPKEPYGISNNARGLFGLPSYRDARFEVRQSRVIQKIKLK